MPPAHISTLSVAEHNQKTYRHRPEQSHDSLQASVPTPHDAVLGALQGPSQAAVSTIGPPRLSALPSVASLEHTRMAERSATPSAGPPRSATSSPQGIAYEQHPLSDPFSGNLVGVMVPRKEAMASLFDQRRDELWARMSSIRELQSEVARLHVQMEGIGLNDVRGGKRATGVGARMHSDTIPVAEEWVEPDGAANALEEQRKRERDAEFTKLAHAFEARREDIDAIMNKLGDLSEALTTFHGLPTPVMDFSTSRSTTKDLMPMSPDLTALRSPSIAASASPELPPVLPKFVLSDADKHDFHESPVATEDELARAFGPA